MTHEYISLKEWSTIPEAGLDATYVNDKSN